MARQLTPFDVASVPPPWRKALERELGRLRAREDVLALGIAGSFAYGDTWQGSDLDIEVVVKGDKPKEIVTTEQEVSVDYGYFGETHLNEIPFETRPVYDPIGILSKELTSRDMNTEIERAIQGDLDRSEELISRSKAALGKDPYSALALLQFGTNFLPHAFTLSVGDNRTLRRAVSRLERSCNKVQRRDFLESYGAILGFPKTLARAEELLTELEQGYREVWAYFKGKPLGPRYMQLQPDSEAWFRNRIRPVYENDKHDLVWLVFAEFPFVLYFLFRLAGYERTPVDVFSEAAKFEAAPALWRDRYRQVLGQFEPEQVPELINTGEKLLAEVRELSTAKLWTQQKQS